MFGGLFIANGDLNPIVLATFALYINVFVSPIEVLVEFTEMFQKGFSGFRRFEEVMNEIPEIQDSKNAKDLKMFLEILILIMCHFNIMRMKRLLTM